MSFFDKISNLLYRRQKLLEMAAAFLFLSAVAFRFDTHNVKLLWSNYPFIALILVFITFLIAIVWVKIERQKTQLLIREIKNNASEKYSIDEEKLYALSGRQKEVFDQIIQGKSNKEIISELNIELSTLKTHINQIYKVLNIKNRKEAQSIGRMLKKDN